MDPGQDPTAGLFTVDQKIFVLKLFCVQNFHGIKFLWLQTTMTFRMCKKLKIMSKLVAFEAIMFTGAFWSSSVGILSCRKCIATYRYLTPLLRAVLRLQVCTARTSRHSSPHPWVGPFLPPSFPTDMALEGMASKSDPSGSRSQCLCLKYRKRTITTHSLPLTHHTCCCLCCK